PMKCGERFDAVIAIGRQIVIAFDFLVCDDGSWNIKAYLCGHLQLQELVVSFSVCAGMRQDPAATNPVKAVQNLAHLAFGEFCERRVDFDAAGVRSCWPPVPD